MVIFCNFICLIPYRLIVLFYLLRLSFLSFIISFSLYVLAWQLPRPKFYLNSGLYLFYTLHFYFIRTLLVFFLLYFWYTFFLLFFYFLLYTVRYSYEYNLSKLAYWCNYYYGLPPKKTFSRSLPPFRAFT
jgi:hypothetical protein